jgi:hypothetical protein
MQEENTEGKCRRSRAGRYRRAEHEGTEEQSRKIERSRAGRYSGAEQSRKN